MRGHGEGTIWRRKGGQWVAVVTMPDGRRRSAYARSRSEAQNKLAELIRQRDERIDPRRLRLGPYLQRWVTDVTGLAPATMRQHEMIVRYHLEPALGSIPLGLLRPSDVDTYLRRTDLDPQTLRHHRSTLRRALRDAIREGLITRNAAALSNPPKLGRKERRYLDAAQVRTLIEGTRGDRLHALWVLAVTTGLREAECLGLAWSDVGPDSLTVRYQLARIKGEWKRVSPKTAKSRRVVPLTALAVEALREHREVQDQERGDYPQPIDGLVFTSTKGHPIHGSNLLPPLYRTLSRLGLPRVAFHDLRHSAATVLLAEGVALPVISAILGHSSIRVTADIYAHVLPEATRDAARRMQEALS